MTTRGDGPRVGRLERLAIHPVFFALFPVLFLWSRNVNEVFTEDVWPILLAVLGATVAGWLVIALVYRDLRRGALVASVAATAALSYGHVASELAPWLGVGGVLVVVAVSATLTWFAGPTALGIATSLANVVAVVLVLTTLPPLVSHALGASGGQQAREEVAESIAGQTRGPVRDIYYVILDRYPREDSMQEVFGYDNSAFTGFLEEHGFDVADRSLANYPKTAHSLAASLNMSYLDRLEETVPASQLDDWSHVYRMLDDHQVGRTLTEIGYEYLHLGTWWAPTSKSVHADRILTYDTSSEFSRVFRSTTVWPAIEAALGVERPTSDRELLAAFTRHQFDMLDRLADDRGNAPRFVFAHLTVPHEPYVFDADGSFVTAEEERSRNRFERFVPHLQYANTRIQGFVERLLEGRASDDEPIVVIQSDEGPHPVKRVGIGPDYTWLDAPLADLREKLRILNAYHLPGIGDEEISEDITPVNTFRLILRLYFGADLPPLRDVVYVFPDESRLYRFTDVTDRVRGG